MYVLKEFINSLQQNEITIVIVPICIIILSWILSEAISFGIIKLFKFNVKNPKTIKESALYIPLKIFIRMFGIYIAIIFLQAPLKIGENAIIWINKVFKIITTIVVSRGIGQSFTIKSTFAKHLKEKTTKNIDDSMIKMILKVIRALIYICAGVIVITELGYNLNGLIAGLGVGGIIITLAAQDTAKNLFGGLVIFIDKPFIVGDWIQMDTYEGTVEDITFRSTRIRTFDNSVVNIPNSVISNASIINWSKMEKRRYKTKLILQRDTQLEKVEKLIEDIRKVLLKYENIEDDSIIVRFDEINQDGIQILLSTYTDSVDYMSYLKEKELVNYKIMQLVKDENIKLAYNTQTVNIIK